MAFMGLLPSFGSALAQRAGTGGTGDVAYGLILSSVGLGSILGPLTLAALARRANERRLLVAMALLSGVTLVLLGAARTLAVAAVAAVTVGASQALFMTLLYKRSQTLSKEAMRGRVASFTFFFAAGVMGVFNLGLGLLATLVPAGLIMEVAGSAFIVATTILLMRVPVLRWTLPAQQMHLAASRR